MRKTTGCADMCGKQFKVRICAEDGLKCDSVPAALNRSLCSDSNPISFPIHVYLTVITLKTGFAGTKFPDIVIELETFTTCLY